MSRRVVSNDDLARIYGIETTDEWIARRTGVRERPSPRRVSGPQIWRSRRPAPRSMRRVSRLRTSISSCSAPCRPTRLSRPGAYLQQLLDFPEAGAFIPCMDVRTSALGFCMDSATPSRWCGQDSRSTLLVGAEVHSRRSTVTRGRTVASLFGDGAGAVVVSRPRIAASDGSRWGRMDDTPMPCVSRSGTSESVHLSRWMTRGTATSRPVSCGLR